MMMRPISFRPSSWRRGLGGQTSRAARRTFATNNYPGSELPLSGLPRAPFVRPVLWSLTASGVIYLGCAGYDVYQDIQVLKSRGRGFSRNNEIKYEDTEGRYQAAQVRNPFQQTTTKEQASQVLTNMTGEGSLFTALVLSNITAFALTRLVPGTSNYFAHIPASARNYTLLTHMFGHTGLIHLGLNMFGLFTFGGPVARSKTFERNASHLTAFYLCSGIMAGLTHHLSTMLPWKNPVVRALPALGASGAVMAIVGAFATLFPHAKIGIVLIPFSLPASQFLPALLLFETWGTLIGYRFLNWGHGAHLAGLLTGMGYIKWDGKERLWRPARKMAFNQMKRMGLTKLN